MAEWDIYLVIVSLLGTAVVIAKPVLSLNTSITRLNESITKLSLDLTDLENSNRKSHERLWEKNEKQDNNLADHETRIQILEEKEK